MTARKSETTNTGNEGLCRTDHTIKLTRKYCKYVCSNVLRACNKVKLVNGTNCIYVSFILLDFCALKRCADPITGYRLDCDDMELCDEATDFGSDSDHRSHQSSDAGSL